MVGIRPQMRRHKFRKSKDFGLNRFPFTSTVNMFRASGWESVCSEHTQTWINIFACGQSRVHIVYKAIFVKHLSCVVGVFVLNPLWGHCLLKSSKDLQLWPLTAFRVMSTSTQTVCVFALQHADAAVDGVQSSVTVMLTLSYTAEMEGFQEKFSDFLYCKTNNPKVFL